MANYRFKTAEIEAMKKNILTHIEHETETKTAWRLRCAIEGQLMCCRPSKREAARLERELALYERLTKNDLPNWQTALHTRRNAPNFKGNRRDGKCIGGGRKRGAEGKKQAYICGRGTNGKNRTRQKQGYAHGVAS